MDNASAGGNPDEQRMTQGMQPIFGGQAEIRQMSDPRLTAQQLDSMVMGQSAERRQLGAATMTRPMRSYQLGSVAMRQSTGEGQLADEMAIGLQQNRQQMGQSILSGQQLTQSFINEQQMGQSGRQRYDQEQIESLNQAENWGQGGVQYGSQKQESGQEQERTWKQVNGGELRSSEVGRWENAGALGQAVMGMPEVGTMPPVVLGEITNERERTELEGGKALSTEGALKRAVDREGVTKEEMAEVNKMIDETKNDPRERQKIFSKMSTDFKFARYGWILGDGNK